eukprot:CAMPEP_0194697388 /NCGR_PEP_ID=MMETSP0295-20121207/23383_1 /TAXON_ID=39354 /ORGANISM="Heterosigma akashiwo, Strain CCMP2393" /LENGTH=320 /DNA_ID=CAMNT_0039590023 /DNA_START=40 /DNA_END=1000 /DNA_ORIENTATION=-
MRQPTGAQTVRRQQDEGPITIEQAGLNLAKSIVASPKFKVSFVLWAIGMFLCAFAAPPFQLTEEASARYEGLMDQAYSFEGYAELEEKLGAARLNEVHVFFWRMRGEPYTTLVPQRRAAVDQIKDQIRALDKERDLLVKEAKATVGVWSQAAMDEARGSFWSAFEQGKLFAQRRAFWNTLFMLMQRREGGALSFVIEWVLTAVANFTLGLLGSLFYFSVAVLGLAWSYSPNMLSFLAFVGLALLAAGSMVATYLLAVAGGLYGLGKVAQAAERQRLEQAHAERAGYAANKKAPALAGGATTTTTWNEGRLAPARGGGWRL